MSRTDELLIKFLLKETSTEEETEVQRWIAESPANEAYYNDFKKIWDSSKKLEPQVQLDEQAAWQRFRARTSAVEKKEALVVPLKKQNYSWLKIAAVLLLAAGAWAAYTLFNQSSYIDIKAGEQVLVKTLPDGSVLTLNKNTDMSFASNFTQHRSIHLKKGDVFFKVTPNKEKPFVINIDQVSVRVVGTSFNIKHLNKQTEVIVETGIVKVSRGIESVELHRGEKVLIQDGTGTLTIEKNNDQLYQYYRSKVFVLNGTPVSRIVEVLNEAYASNIVVSNPQIGHLTLTTTFKEDSLDHILQVICLSLGLKTSKDEGKIILSNQKK